MSIIYINPGHGIGVSGRRDVGAVGPSGLTEAEVTQDLARRVRHLLHIKGMRTASAVESFTDAVRHANALPADLFVSIHCNAACDPAAHGTEIWYHSPAGQKLSTAIMSRVQAQITAGQGSWLDKPCPLRDRGVKAGGFYVLRTTRMPAILIETAFISNPREENWLSDRYFRQQFAQAIADGVGDVLDK